MTKKIKGKAWKFGDNINTDLICPGPKMRLPIEQLGSAAMSGIDPDFYKKITKGDIIVAGDNFGSGSSRELAPIALMKAGIGGIVAKYYGRIFYRNCIALGFPIIESNDASDNIRQGDEIEIDLVNGKIINHTQKSVHSGAKYPKEFLEIFQSGGIISWIKERGVDSL
jgi:3-isopropylmalate/(R)-2-methylmalate dehydratase small subunit